MSNSSSKIRTVEDKEVSPTVQPEDTAGHTDSEINYVNSQMFRQRLKIKNGVKELWWHMRGRLKHLAQSGVNVDNLLDDFSHQVKTVMVDLERLEGPSSNRHVEESNCTGAGPTGSEKASLPAES